MFTVIMKRTYLWALILRFNVNNDDKTLINVREIIEISGILISVDLMYNQLAEFDLMAATAMKQLSSYDYLPPQPAVTMLRTY